MLINILVIKVIIYMTQYACLGKIQSRIYNTDVVSFWYTIPD